MAPKIPKNFSANGDATVEGEDIVLSDDLLRLRAMDVIQVPLLCFPTSERGTTDYEQFNGKDLDRFVDQAAKYYINCGLQPVGEP